MIIEDGSCDGWPGGGDGQQTLDVVALNGFFLILIQQHWLDSKEGERGRAYLYFNIYYSKKAIWKRMILPGFRGVAPGRELKIMPPVSVCQ